MWDVVRPEILDQERGAEPNFQVPEGVTIPDSWAEKDSFDKEAIVRDLENTLNSEYDNLVNRLEEVDKHTLEEWEEARREEESSTPSTPSRTREPSITDRIEDGDFTPDIPDINDLLP